MKLVIATPFYSMAGYSPYISSLVQTAKMLCKADIDWDFWEYSGDSYVDRARNHICARFIETDYTDLLFIDSDMSWSAEGLFNLLRSPHELTGGVYPVKNNWEKYTESIKYEGNHSPVQHIDSGRIEAEWLPAGFLLIKRSCLEKMCSAYEYDWYYSNEKNTELEEPRKIINLFNCKVVDNQRLGEDVSFCKKWNMIGGKCYVEPRISFGHTGSKTYSGNFDEYLLRQAELKRIHGSDDVIKFMEKYNAL